MCECKREKEEEEKEEEEEEEQERDRERERSSICRSSVENHTACDNVYTCTCSMFKISITFAKHTCKCIRPNL